MILRLSEDVFLLCELETRVSSVGMLFDVSVYGGDIAGTRIRVLLLEKEVEVREVKLM